MDKFRIILKKLFNKLKILISSTIKYLEVLFQNKKSIDDTYITIEQSKIKEVKNLEAQLKNIQFKNSHLEKEILIMKDSIDKKIKLIESLQDLVAKRSD